MSKSTSDAAIQPILLYVLISVFSIIANIVAFIDQFLYYDLPCTLCVLQRFGILMVGFGAISSIKHNPAVKYDVIIIFASLLTGFVGLRQVLLHITPPDLGFGNAFLGLHLYTWSALWGFLLILVMALAPFLNKILEQLIMLKHRKNKPVDIPHVLQSRYSIGKILHIILTLVVLSEIVSTYLECGFAICPSDPHNYLKLH